MKFSMNTFRTEQKAISIVSRYVQSLQMCNWRTVIKRCATAATKQVRRESR